MDVDTKRLRGRAEFGVAIARERRNLSVVSSVDRHSLIQHGRSMADECGRSRTVADRLKIQCPDGESMNAVDDGTSKTKTGLVDMGSKIRYIVGWRRYVGAGAKVKRQAAAVQRQINTVWSPVYLGMMDGSTLLNWMDLSQETSPPTPPPPLVVMRRPARL